MDLEELTPYEGTVTVQEVHTYQQMVWSINYPATISRPDITYTAQRLAEFLTNPGLAHQVAVQKYIRYLYKMRFLALSYGIQDIDPVFKIMTDARMRDFKASSDASYGDCSQTQRSTQEFVFLLFGGAIDWQSAK